MRLSNEKNRICLKIVRHKIRRYRKEHPFIFYFLVLYLGVLFIYAAIFHMWFADYSKAMPLNEIGDFLAGVFAPIVFLFLYLGYKQNSESIKIQSAELRASTDAMKLQVAEMKNSVDQQKTLIEIQNDEIKAKHFSAKPFLTFKVHHLHKYEEPYDVTDQNDEYIETIIRKLCEFQLTIENYGEISKQISFINEDNTLFWQLYELGKNEEIDKKIALDDDEVDQLEHNKYFTKTFIVQYFDQYGKEYKTNLQYEIKYYDPEDEFYVSCKTVVQNLSIELDQSS